jgi:hypothetical protein
MKSVWRSGMNSRWVCVPSSQPLPKAAAGADGDGRLDDVVARPSGSLSGRSGQDALALVVVQHVQAKRRGGRGGRPARPMITFHGRPAKKIT